MRNWITLAVALIFLDASLTFENVWPTPLITWTGQISIELAVLALVLLAYSRQCPHRTIIRWSSAPRSRSAVAVRGRPRRPYGRDANLY
jgi:hypothetical protein